MEAALPREKKEDTPAGEEVTEDKPVLRVSRQELYTEVMESSAFNEMYIAMVVLSSIVAAIGLVKDSVAAVIGAMVIAPLLGPNVALALVDREACEKSIPCCPHSLDGAFDYSDDCHLLVRKRSLLNQHASP